MWVLFLLGITLSAGQPAITVQSLGSFDTRKECFDKALEIETSPAEVMACERRRIEKIA